jgi:branched-chain amino acid transport system ATP-binding protein
MALLEVTSVSKRFGELRALAGVDLRVEADQIHGLIGPNGSGKSTLMKCIAGALMADTGAIRFADRDITRAVPSERARAGLSIKFQITSVLPSLSVYDNVLLALQGRDSLVSLLRSRTRRALHESVTAALERFPLRGRADQLAGTLSHGEQQWLEIAMALATEPTLLLLDEPTAGMSLEERRLTGELLAPIKTRCAILIVEHDLDFIRDVSDVLTVLDQGSVLDTGSVEAIQASPKVQEVYLTRV